MFRHQICHLQGASSVNLAKLHIVPGRHSNINTTYRGAGTATSTQCTGGVSLTTARSIQSTLFHLISLKSIFILPSHPRLCIPNNLSLCEGSSQKLCIQFFNRVYTYLMLQIRFCKINILGVLC